MTMSNKEIHRLYPTNCKEQQQELLQHIEHNENNKDRNKKNSNCGLLMLTLIKP